MKHLTNSACCFLLSFFLWSAAQGQNVLTKAPTALNALPAAAVDVLQARNGLISHLVAGNTGQFGANDQWIGIGAPLAQLYGERTQWNGQAFIKALRSQNPAVPNAVKDAIIEWGNQGGELQFRYITNPFLPTGNIRIHTLTSAGNAYYNFQPSVISGTPKVGIGTDNQACIAGRTTNTTAAEFISGADDFATATGVAGYVKSGGQSSVNTGVSGTIIISPAFSTNYGVYGEIPGGNVDPSSTNYGVFGSVPNIGTSFAGFFQGDVFTTGLYLGSDKKLKENVVKEDNALDILRRLNPVSYSYKAETYKGFNLPTTKQHGLIAQEVQAVLPELVRTTRYTTKDESGKSKASDEFLSVNYQGLIPILIKAVQEQQAQIDALTAEKNQPKDAVVNNDPKVIVTAAGKFAVSEFALSQNTPNPFSSSTTIRYTLPAGISNGTIGVFDLNGKLQLQYSGLRSSAQVVIDGNTLAPGMYIYSLLAEGQEVISRKMILTR